MHALKKIIVCTLAVLSISAAACATAATPSASASPSGACASAYPSSFVLAQGQLAVPAPAMAKPAKGVAVTDPVAKTCVVRATDHVADGVSGFAVNDYSRREPFNADDTRFMVNSGNGFWHLYDATSLKHIGTIAGLSGDAEAQWSPTDPNIIYYTANDGGLQINAVNVATNTTSVVSDLTGKLPWANAAHCWTKSEGSPSKDGRYWGLQCEDSGFNILGFIVWDIVANKLVGSTNISTRPDNTSMSPSGRWMISNGFEGVFAYSPDFKTKKQLYTTTEHSDIAVGANGDDMFVSIDYGSGDGSVFMVDIDTGVRTDLFPTYVNGSTSAFHISGKAFNLPGWVLVSAYAGSPSRDGTTPWFEERVFAVQLAANPKIYQIAAHRSTPYNGYWSEPHAAPNRSFTRLLFNSSWLTGSATDIDTYMVQLPVGALSAGTTPPPPPPPATAPTANFTSAVNGLTATFTDASTDVGGSIVTRAWNFGDGTSSATTNPSHTYAAAGSYSVVLTVTDSGGVSATSTQSVKLTAPVVVTKPTAGFSVAVNGLNAVFTDASTDTGGSIVSRAWNFGDGATSTATNPSHAYAAGGSYSVVLTVTDSGGASATSSHSVALTAPTVTPPPVTSSNGPCANFYPSGFALAAGELAVPAPALAKPAKAAVLSEPSFHTCLVRATNHATDGISGYAANDHSRRQPFNADDSRFIVASGDGTWYLYDANSLQKIAALNGPSGNAEPQWHPTNPNILYYLPANGGTKIYALDIGTKAITVAADFSGQLPFAGAAHVWTHGEGSPSRDGRYWGLQVEDANFNILGLIVWDMIGNRLVGSTPTSTRPNNVSMSPSGRWLVSSASNGVFAWSTDFTVKRQLHTQTENADIATGANGDDVFVSIDYQSGSGSAFMVDIDTGVRTDLFSTYLNGASSALDFSAKAYAAPGWVLISAFAGNPARDGSVPWFEERVFAVQLAANPQVFQLAAHRSTYNGAPVQPYAATNRNFTRVLFNSNWGSSNAADMDAYMIQLPANMTAAVTVVANTGVLAPRNPRTQPNPVRPPRQ